MVTLGSSDKADDCPDMAHSATAKTSRALDFTCLLFMLGTPFGGDLAAVLSRAGGTEEI
jgi:hypothetical protein